MSSSTGTPACSSHPLMRPFGWPGRRGSRPECSPAVSAEDCLVADLGFDPGASGCQSYEATSFLIYRRRFDTSTPLILWQVAGVGVSRAATRPSRSGLRVLAEYLVEHYGPDHEVVLYEASPYPVFDPIIEHVRLRDLARARLTPMSTMLVPAKGSPRLDRDVMARLKIRMPDPARAKRLGSSSKPDRTDHRSKRRR